MWTARLPEVCPSEEWLESYLLELEGRGAAVTLVGTNFPQTKTRRLLSP